jgi:two-component system chemotaxis sensor kinase CheA
MTKNKEKFVKTIRKIQEDIDTINLSDQGAWEGIRIELETLVQNFPKNMSVLLKTLGLCLQGVQSLTDKTKTHSFALIEALSNALNAAEHYLLNNPDKKPVIQKAELLLQNALASKQGELGEKRSSETDRPVDPSTVSLDDAAVLLIQLESDDLCGLTGLKESLNQIAEDTSYPGSCRKYITRAAKKLEGIIEARVEDPEIVLTEVGELLDEALNSPEKSSREANAVWPGDSVIKLDGEPADGLSTGSDTGQNSAHEAQAYRDSFMKRNGQPADDNSATDYMPQDADPDLLTEFTAESADLITCAEEALLALELDPEDMDAVNTVFRAFHTIKGTAAFMDLCLISEMGHHAESLLSRVRDREIRYSGGYADISLRALDMLKELIASVQNALRGDRFSKPDGYDELMDILVNPETAGISDEVDEISIPRLGDILVAQESVSRETVEGAAGCQAEEPIGITMVKSKAASIKDVGQALRTQKHMQGAARAVDSSVRVSTQRLDRLIDMVGEMVIAHSMVAEDAVVANGNHHELVKKVTHTSKIVRELQSISMSMRMVPLKSTFNKMARLVRDLSRKAGKNITFIADGEDTEIDRNLVDRINDPLIHLVRNAADHGIEPPDIRVRTNKPENGTIRLSAYHSAGNVVVEIEDDGKGLEREVILAKARELGLVSDGSTLSDRKVFNLIFEPGFSTAQSVTDVSGRGVGMDVVKKNIEALRGQIEIKSELGIYSLFKLCLPLTLAIIDGMVIRMGRETYVIPTASIIQSVNPDPGDISTVINKGEMLSWQGKLIPVFRLADLYQIEGSEQDALHALVMVVEDGDRQVGLLVDELIGRQQVVIKTLGEALEDIAGISGGAILPNGRVGLILDVGELIRLATTGLKQEVSQKRNDTKHNYLAA